MRFHLVSLPHVPATRVFCSCAYTQKVLKFAQMMKSLGHTVIHYGGEGSEVVCDEHVTVITADERDLIFDNQSWQQLNFQLDWDFKAAHWRLFNGRAFKEIEKRKQKGDFVCCIAGSHAPLANLKEVHIVEFGIGYFGTFAHNRVFESNSHMTAVYMQQANDPDGRHYDTVIPNYFDPTDYEFSAQKDKYILYMGRLIQRKGIAIVQDICKYMKIPVRWAGQGAKEIHEDHIITEENQRIDLINGSRYVGFADIKLRSELMRNARAVIVPTTYFEPFGGVAVEAMMSGTPAITSNHGAFPETVLHGVSGYRCQTLDQYLWAVAHADRLDSHKIRKYAVNNYGMDRVRWMYQEYFNMVSHLDGKGWYTFTPRKDLSWLDRL